MSYVEEIDRLTAELAEAWAVNRFISEQYLQRVAERDEALAALKRVRRLAEKLKDDGLTGTAGWIRGAIDGSTSR